MLTQPEATRSRQTGHNRIQGNASTVARIVHHSTPSRSAAQFYRFRDERLLLREYAKTPP